MTPLKFIYPLLGFSLLIPFSPVTAQIIPDNTLGTEQSTVNSTTLDGLPTEMIEGGATRGEHLFHSFSEFNVQEAQRVYFANPSGINNILSRVTGNNISEILGTLGVNGGANLYLINPNGILFGENAQLDIRGSFYATTADHLLFDNYEFSAKNPDSPPLLTLNITPGIQYPDNSQGTITNQGNLTVGEDLTLVGQNLDVTGNLESGENLTLLGTDTITIKDSIDRPIILNAGQNLLIQGNETIDIFALNHLDSGLVSGGDLTLRSQNAISGDAHFWVGGTFSIEKLDETRGDFYSKEDPIVLATGNVMMNDYTGASLHILAGGSVTIGDINITDSGTDNTTINTNNSDPFIKQLAQFNLSDGTPVEVDGSSATYHTLDIRAGIDWSQIGGLPVSLQNTEITLTPVAVTYNNLANRADINVGEIDINGVSLTPIGTGGQVFLTNQYFANNLPGNITVDGVIDTRDLLGGGLVYIDSRNDINVNQGINASSFLPKNMGNGGNVILLSNETITLGAEILSEGLEGGNITLEANNPLVLDYGVFSRSYSSTSKNQGGNIEITTSQTLTIQAGARLSTQTVGTVNAGNITVNAGAINIQNKTNLASDTGIVANTAGTGIAGNIALNTGEMYLDNGFIFANTFRDSTSPTAPLGDGGQITVNTNDLTLENGSFLSTASQSEGVGGTIQVNANNSVNLIGTNDQGLPSGFIFGGFSSGDAGQLRINTRDLSITGGGLISGSAYDSGKAGDITVNARESVTVQGSGLNAPSGLVYETGGTGNAGNFTLETGALNILDGGNVSAQSIGTGNAGTFTVDARDILVRGESGDGRFQSRLFFDSANAGNAGRLQVQTQRLRVEEGGQVAGTTRGSGDGGFLGVNATELVNIDGSGSGLFFESLGSGDARGIELRTGDLTVQN
ncbi:filamentous hemagglutinin N-terminal domain-containing protein, partial [Spirulina sp. CS-785/01]|uniref:two-partner secretion domain-containing protein n=1 Tax=Spirulina sp. CS-785/01 TaxID=3021716 RepID=UPI0023313FA6